MPLLVTKKLTELQHTVDNIRNICILAHVDHGKTTLADSLVASNGIISQRMAGKLRYMDSRKDEQERGITMKSSAISLCHSCDDSEYLVNLIDSPGHVDFSSEVSTAVRLCDGAIVVVDVVEGVQPQTKVVLQQAWSEDIRPVLVLNKIDRLIVELKMTPLDAYIHLSQVLEQVNAITAELFTTDVMEKKFDGESKRTKTNSTNEDVIEEYFDWTTGLEEADDSDLYFSPDQGNVIFASAFDGWAFDLDSFARIYSAKLGFNVNVLRKTLWGDYFINMKAKKIMRGAQSRAKKPLFVQLILENIYSVYECIFERKDKERLEKIIASLNIKVAARDVRSNDPRQQLAAVFSQWLPLSNVVLDMVCRKLPGPAGLDSERVEKLMCSRTKRFDVLPAETQALKQSFLDCSASDEAPVIVFVSKMFPVQRKFLPENRPKPLTPQEMAVRREAARLRLAAEKPDSGVSLTAEQLDKLKLETTPSKPEEDQDDTAFVAFARVYSGTLRPGRTLYVLGPKYDPARTLDRLQAGECLDFDRTVHEKSATHIMKATVGRLYLLLGRELEELEHAPAGNIVGIGGLDDHILKSATVSSNLACPPFVEVKQSAVPILRVAVEPTRSTDMPALIQGLHLLNQADANVQVVLTDKGEHILVTAGEVHLERCLLDLKETFAPGVEVTVSTPIVPFRETVVPPPKTDMVNEQLNEENKVAGDKETGRAVEIQTPNKQCTIVIRAVPLKRAITDLLEANAELFRAMESSQKLSEQTLEAKREVKEKLKELFEEEDPDYESDALHVDKIWSLGPRKCGPNLLINNIPGHPRSSVWDPVVKGDTQLFEYDSSFVNGFQLATLAGPLCEEPLMGVAFLVEAWQFHPDVPDSGVYGPLSGQIVSTVKDGCRRAFQTNPQRLMAAMYSCDVQVKVEVLGKMYAVLGKRHGRIVKEDMVEGSSTFTVTAHLPVVESFDFANEIRKQTSGLAMPQLVFSHWEVLEVDPFWEPQSEEELLHFGAKADSENQARKYMNDVRKKKGLAIDEKIVEFAEKQRTLTKSK